MKGFDTRRAALSANTDCHADVLVAITGISEGPRTGSTLAFARSALVADFPQDSEQRNVIVLAHELAHLFGAPDEPDALNTIMRTQPQTDKFSSKTVTLIRQLWGYPFASGIDGLRGEWDRRAFDAITAASAGVYTNPVSHAHEVLAVSYLAERRRPAAIGHLSQAVKAEPENPGVHFDLGFALIENSQLDAALPELREAIRLSPQDARMHRQLGLTLVKLGHTPDGLKEFEEAARLDPRNPDTHSDLGACELNAGNIPAAIREFEKAIQLQPSHGVAHASLAMVFYREKQYDKAWDEVAKARQSGFEPPAPFIADLIQHKPK
jgi:Flp pilus assembly protein TadD